MPYDTNGNYSLPPIYIAISGTTINPAQHNTPLEDVQAAHASHSDRTSITVTLSGP